MKCSQGHENPPRYRFCALCGEPLPGPSASPGPGTGSPLRPAPGIEAAPNEILIFLPTEQVIANFRELRVNNLGGFSATVTNYRLLFWQTGRIHDIRLDAIAALSWVRSQIPPWALIIFGGFVVLLAIFAWREDPTIGFLILLVGGLLIALSFIYRMEALEVYTTGAKSFSVTGPKEALLELYRAIRQQGA